MLLGLFQRHYKIYRGLSFIPFHFKNPESLTTIIGNNGYGKSSILEGVDTFFNNRPFNINLNEKKTEAFVAPLFLITHQQFLKFPKDIQSIIEVIDEHLWEESTSKGPSYGKLTSFFECRDKLESLDLRKDNYLLFASKEYSSNDRFFSSFTSSIVKKIELMEIDYTSRTHSKLITELKKLYSYIYIPVETSIEEFLKIETTGMQSLVDKKIMDEIHLLLTNKVITFTRKSRKTKWSLLDIINNNLEKYIDDVETRIKSIDSTYDFRVQQNTKKRLTSNDLKEQIIYAYLSRRTLRKEKKPIKHLSAGERKKALIDIAFSLIDNNSTREKFVIVAIDEPESSLHISNCFQQFRRIEDMSQASNCQIITTTHWYGALPIINKGTLVHINLSETGLPLLKNFNFRNYFEDRRGHPDDVQLKSFYDLTSSIISSIRYYDTNWLIVEGSDDVNYISKFLFSKKINILPVGGCSIVKLIYDFLYVPLSHKSEDPKGTGKIYCLIDTDHSGQKIQNTTDIKSKKLILRRLQIVDSEVKLIRDDRHEKIPLEIEETMNPEDFYNALINATKSVGDTEIEKLLKEFTVVKKMSYSKIKGDDSMLEFSGLAKDLKKAKAKLLDFIESNKEVVSSEFSALPKVVKPFWIKEIELFFT